ncbi:MAG: IPT/TIG domain-containing protein [Bryobacteraceae bacterium]
MKRLGILFLSLSAVFAQQPAVDFLTGQAARETIGQPTFTSENVGNPSQDQIGAVQGLAYVNDMLFVVDSNLHGLIPPVNNRVMIYTNISRFIYDPTAEVPQGNRCNVCVGTAAVGNASAVLGQPNFTSVTNPNTTQSGFRDPTFVASDGKILVVSDTDNNRVLIWNSIPTTAAQNDAPADIVLGQADFTTANIGLSSSGMRGPQGVWVQGTRLFVADTQNHRVLIWNSIPTANNQPADLVLGEPNFTTAPASTVSNLPPTASNLFSPVSVTSDGQHVFVADLGHNRVLIWNSIPTQNGQAADVVVGQPNMTSELDDGFNSTCVPNGVDADNYPTYPNCVPTTCPTNGTDSAGTVLYQQRCGNVMELPRYALSDGHRLFIADSGNDRVLVYNSVPTTNGVTPDIFLGQPDEFTDQVTTSTNTFRPDANILESSANTTRTPYGLAWDGTNLYVSDPFDVRVMVFTLGTPSIPITGVTNSASLNTYAVGTVSLTGTITTSDTVTIEVSSANVATGTCPPASGAGYLCYTYTVKSTDTLASIVIALANLINAAPDPNVIASANVVSGSLFVVNLIARQPGLNGNGIGYAASTASASSTGTATEVATAAGAALAGGAAAAELAPGTLVTIYGSNLADVPSAGIYATPDANGNYPTTNFNGVQVYFDGIRSPILFVSPTQINTQLPYEVSGANGVSVYVRTVHSDGSITATNAIGVPVVQENPGIFALAGTDPRAVVAYHTSGNAIALVDVDGSPSAGDVATIKIGSNSYNYTVQSTDTLQSVRDGLIILINANANEQVTASPAGEFARIVLTAKVGGPAGNGIQISGSTSTNATITISPLGDSATCCANVAGSLVTPDNPVVPGEVITIYATGIGPTTLPDGLTPASVTGQVYPGPALNVPVTNVDNAQVGGTTANVISAGLAVGMLPGTYAVVLQTQSSLPTNLLTQMYIAQNVFTSNIVTIPVVAQLPPSSTSAARKDTHDQAPRDRLDRQRPR